MRVDQLELFGRKKLNIYVTVTSFWHKNKKCHFLKVWGDFSGNGKVGKMFWVGWGDVPEGVASPGSGIGYTPL